MKLIIQLNGSDYIFNEKDEERLAGEKLPAAESNNRMRLYHIEILLCESI